MASNSSSSTSKCCLLLLFVILFSISVFVSLLTFLHYPPSFPITTLTTSSSSCTLLLPPRQTPPPSPFNGSLPSFTYSWNSLPLPSPPHSPPLRIAVFVKKWPTLVFSGGLERHALTLHRALADRGHIVHVFSTQYNVTSPFDEEDKGLHLHISVPNASGKLDIGRSWKKFLQENVSKPFDIVHTESVVLPHWKAKTLSNVVVSWHGIAYEIIHSDIVTDLIRRPEELRETELERALAERVPRVIDEIKFFRNYDHHVATSDYVGDILRTIYEIPLEKVHIILNGVDQRLFQPDPLKGEAFRNDAGVPEDAKLVLGVSGRLVKDKGHPLLFEAFSKLIEEHPDIFLMVAGDGPWMTRYQELGSNVKVLGALPPHQLPDFYNALDVFVNPTLRAQGLDHTLLEAMLCGKPLVATHFSSITRSIIVDTNIGYTFAPNVPSLLNALNSVINDGKDIWERKGEFCHQRASKLFTATKMASAYERLFLCIRNATFCQYPLPTDLQDE